MLEIDEAANERMDILMPQLMKAADQMKWIELADACKVQVEEIVLNQFVYGDRASTHRYF